MYVSEMELSFFPKSQILFCQLIHYFFYKHLENLNGASVHHSEPFLLFRDDSELVDYPLIFLHCLRFLRYSMEKYSFGITVVGCSNIHIENRTPLKRHISQPSVNIL